MTDAERIWIWRNAFNPIAIRITSTKDDLVDDAAWIGEEYIHADAFAEQISATYKEIAQTRRKALEEAEMTIETFDVGGSEYNSCRDQFELISDMKDVIRAMIDKEPAE